MQLFSKLGKSCDSVVFDRNGFWREEKLKFLLNQNIIWDKSRKSITGNSNSRKSKIEVIIID